MEGSTLKSNIYDPSVAVTAYYAYQFQPNLKVKIATDMVGNEFVYGPVHDLTPGDMNTICQTFLSRTQISATSLKIRLNDVNEGVFWEEDYTSEQTAYFRGKNLQDVENQNANVGIVIRCVSSNPSPADRTYQLVSFPTVYLHAAFPKPNEDGTITSEPYCYEGDYLAEDGLTEDGDPAYQCSPCNRGFKCPLSEDGKTNLHEKCNYNDYQDLEGQTTCKYCIGNTINLGVLEKFAHIGCNWHCDKGLECPVTPSYEEPPRLCPEGYYSDESVFDQVKLCKPIPEGHTVVTAEEDKYNFNKDDLHVDINICRIGHMCPSPKEDHKCLGQLYQDEEGQTECKECPLITIPDENDPDEEKANIGCLISCPEYQVLIGNKCYSGCGCKREELDTEYDWIVPASTPVNGSIAYQYLPEGGYVVRECDKIIENNEWNGNCTWGDHIYHRNPFVESTVSFDMLYDFTGVSLDTLKTYKYYFQRVFLRMFPEISYRFDVMGLHHSATPETHLANVEKSMLFFRADIFGDRYLEARYPLEWLEDFQDRLSAMFHEVFGEMFNGVEVIPVQHSEHINNPDGSCIGYPYCEYDRRTNCTIAVGDCHNYDERISIIQGEYYEYHGDAESSGECYWGGDNGYFVRKCSSMPYEHQWAILDPTGMWEKPAENHRNPHNLEHQWVSVVYEFHGLPVTFFTNNITYALPSVFLKHAARSTLHDLYMSPPYPLNQWVPEVAEEDLEMDSCGINVRVEVDDGDYDAVLHDMITCEEGGDYNVCERIEQDLAEFNTKFHVPYYITAKRFD